MDNKKKNAKQGRKYSTMAIAMLALFLVGAVLLNLLAYLVTSKAGMRWDITDNRLYEISDTTVDLLKTLPEPIEVTVLESEYVYQNTGTYRPIREVLMRYEQISGGKLTVRYVDPYSNPDIVEQFSEISSPTAADIIIKSSKRYKSMHPSDLYDMRMDYNTNTYQQGLQAEQKFSSAIMYCLADELPKAIRTRGHDEEDLSSLNSLLTTANYTLDLVNLAVDDIPSDTAILIITNPKEDFVDKEIAALEDYLAGGGNLIIFYDAMGKHLSKFELFMEDWGVKPQDYLICDSQRAYTSPVAIVPSLNTSHSALETMTLGTGDYLVSPYSRSWELPWGNGTVKGFRRASALMTSSSTSYGKSVSDGANISSYTKQDGDVDGPFYIGVIAEENNPNTGNHANILFLSSYAAGDVMLQNDMFLNRKFMISAINFMNEDADALIVEARYAQSTSLALTKSDANTIFWSLCVVVPVAVLVVGGGVWIRRRNR